MNNRDRELPRYRSLLRCGMLTAAVGGRMGRGVGGGGEGGDTQRHQFYLIPGNEAWN